ncbi:MAG: peptidylprolyl isomerase [Chloroflexi bacterium]|nr:peptidylprolyl isomerase [Chloroflexota bacterium]
MVQAKKGDKVKVLYTGKLEDGSVFDSSGGDSPLEFTLGQGQVIPGFDQGVLGMEPGESKVLNIPVDQAYGPHNPDAVFEIDRSELPPDIPLEVGLRMQGNQPGGRVAEITIVEFDDAKVKMDSNHPLAGQALTFDIQLVAIG